MPFSSGPNTVNDSSVVFAFDTGDSANSYKGQPITNQQSVLGTSGFGPSANNNVYYPVNGTGTFVRLGFGQTFGGYTIQPNDVVYRYDLGSNGCHYHGFDTAIPAGSYATFTFDYLVADATNYPSTNFLANFEIAFGGSAGAPNSLQNVWQTVSFTGGPTGGSSTLRSLLYPGGCGGRLADSGYILYKNPQVTYTPYSVPFVQGTRSTTQGLLDVSGVGNTIDLANMTYGADNALSFDGVSNYTTLGNVNNYFGSGVGGVTTEAVFKITPGASGNDGPIFENYRYNVWYSYGSDLINFYTRSGPPDTPGYQFAVSMTSNTACRAKGLYNHLVAIYQTFSTGTGTVALYINGQPAGSATGVMMGNYPLFNPMIGQSYHSGYGTYRLNGQVPITRVYNRALGASEIQQNYNAYKKRFNLP